MKRNKTIKEHEDVNLHIKKSTVSGIITFIIVSLYVSFVGLLIVSTMFNIKEDASGVWFNLYLINFTIQLIFYIIGGFFIMHLRHGD